MCLLLAGERATRCLEENPKIVGVEYRGAMDVGPMGLDSKTASRVAARAQVVVYLWLSVESLTNRALQRDSSGRHDPYLAELT